VALPDVMTKDSNDLPDFIVAVSQRGRSRTWRREVGRN
jgi:hypothetical protein